MTAFLASAPHEEPDVWFPLFPVAFVTVAVGCLCIGSWNYLQTYSTTAHQGASSMIAIDDKTRSVAMLISSVLFRSFVIGLGLLIFAAIAFAALTDEIFSLHRNFLDIPRLEFDSILLRLLLHMRLLLFVFFLIPAIAIRWALRKAL